MRDTFQKINNVSTPKCENLQKQPYGKENFNEIKIGKYQNQSSIQNLVSEQSFSDENSMFSNDTTIDLNINSKSPDSLNDSWMVISPEKIENIRKSTSTEKMFKN